MTDPSRCAYFLGGHDLEMLTIRDLIGSTWPEHLFDKKLRWGAKASAYRAEIEHEIALGLEPVLIELQDDLHVPAVHVIVDHHGHRAGAEKPTSLHQVFDLLRLPASRWTRWLQLVAANDRGHIREMRSIGATDEEIARVRAADRVAQGITEADERAGEEALQNAQWLAGDRLVVVRLAHSHSAVVADRLEMDVRQPENLLVVSPNEVNFYGSGTMIATLTARYGGWSGGALPERGFWGQSPTPSDVIEYTATAVGVSAR